MNALFLMRFVRPQKWQVILVARHRLGFFGRFGRECGLREAFNSIGGLGLLGLLNVTDKRLSSDSELCSRKMKKNPKTEVIQINCQVPKHLTRVPKSTRETSVLFLVISDLCSAFLYHILKHHIALGIEITFRPLNTFLVSMEQIIMLVRCIIYFAKKFDFAINTITIWGAFSSSMCFARQTCQTFTDRRNDA